MLLSRNYRIRFQQFEESRHRKNLTYELIRQLNLKRKRSCTSLCATTGIFSNNFHFRWKQICMILLLLTLLHRLNITICFAEVAERRPQYLVFGLSKITPERTKTVYLVADTDSKLVYIYCQTLLAQKCLFITTAQTGSENESWNLSLNKMEIYIALKRGERNTRKKIGADDDPEDTKSGFGHPFPEHPCP